MSNLCFHLKVPPPVVSWNIAPSMGHTYKCKEAELVPIPRYCLKVTEKVGTCHAGEVSNLKLINLILFDSKSSGVILKSIMQTHT